MRTKAVDLTKELKEVGAYLAIGIGAVVNLFNPAVVFVHSPLFDIEPGLLDAIAVRMRSHALAPSFAECRIVRAGGTKRHGAVAGIVQQVFDAVAPEVA
jgi:N-acetylglucosamine repressor